MTPWKNGGGTTAEIAICPPAATIENFAWRISSATVSAAGDFSKFPNCTRFLTVLEGDELGLKVRGRAVSLPPLEVFEFSGDDHVSCELKGSGVRDLNFIFDKNLIEGSMDIFKGNKTVHAKAGTLAVISLSEDVKVENVRLGKLETALITIETPVDIALQAADTGVAWIRIQELKRP